MVLGRFCRRDLQMMEHLLGNEIKIILVITKGECGDRMTRVAVKKLLQEAKANYNVTAKKKCELCCQVL